MTLVDEKLRNTLVSPSMRREWIEMLSREVTFTISAVSLHAEGVD